jgi:predicted MFS family arabinose efflux permease
VNLAAGVGDLAAPLLVAGTAALGWSWRVPLWITTALVAAYGVVVASAPLPHPSAAAHSDEVNPRRGRGLLRRADVWRAGACGAVLVALDESFIAYVIAFLRHDDGASTAVATTVSAVFVVGGLVAAAWLARASHRRVHTLRTPACVMLGATVMLAVAPSPATVALAGFVVGAATVAFWVPFQAAVLRLVPGRAASVSAIVGSLEMIGLAVTPLIGAISDAWGLHRGLTAYACLPALLTLLVWRGAFARAQTQR